MATADAMEKIPNQEDKDFLLAQREPARRGKIGGIDHKQAAMEKRMVKRKVAQRAYEAKSQKETSALSTVSDNADIYLQRHYYFFAKITFTYSPNT